MYIHSRYYFSVLLAAFSAALTLTSAHAKLPSQNTPDSVPALWKDYRRIRETTRLDSPEYRAEIEQVLAAFHERGGADDFEFTLRRQLGLSYRNVKEYAKSTEVLTNILAKGSDPEAKAMVMLWLAQNARDLNDVPTAYRLLEEVVAEYPRTSAGQIAQSELLKPVFGKYARSLPRTSDLLPRKIIIGTCLLGLALLTAVLFARRIGKRSRGMA